LLCHPAVLSLTPQIDKEKQYPFSVTENGYCFVALSKTNAYENKDKKSERNPYVQDNISVAFRIGHGLWL
jgi:hypothetical protein